MGHLLYQQGVIFWLCCIRYYKHLFGGILRAPYSPWCIRLQDWLSLIFTVLMIEKGSNMLATFLERSYISKRHDDNYLELGGKVGMASVAR